MSTQRKTYSRQFKLDAIALYESSEKSAAQIERDLGLPSGALHQWRWRLKQQGEFVGKGHQAALGAEVKRLKRELEVARQERDILKAAGVFFSKDTR